ncbi:GNAT family N-acetyltransferase [Pseudoduganella chitinolytica]|uniref:GNAT family N-acetyltransferase n=1 Tax=Pseudoduganella chitinolytica TaxID=34070 RepID=A0ABY8BA34_9BURK|nr:GNAT family N-acetyltransferase [Pseudoduganella chitinolytica]WEF31858.1 GNAT family N-acetyltransferase [Pseudoduganella chitinolytica]
MIEWQWLEFESIPRRDLYEVLRQRQNVFVLEQTCLYPDLDGYDETAHHLMAWRTQDGERTLAAYLRCLAPGAKYDEMSLGRILTPAASRGTGIGRQLVAEGIRRAEAQHPGHRIRIGAQQRLEKFYQGFGFETVSAPYDEDGILHIDMLR